MDGCGNVSVLILNFGFKWPCISQLVALCLRRLCPSYPMGLSRKKKANTSLMLNYSNRLCTYSPSTSTLDEQTSLNLATANDVISRFRNLGSFVVQQLLTDTDFVVSAMHGNPWSKAFRLCVSEQKDHYFLDRRIEKKKKSA